MSNEISTTTQQPDPVETSHPLLGFFGIGIAINVILVTAYLVWAFRQWKKKDHHES